VHAIAPDAAQSSTAHVVDCPQLASKRNSAVTGRRYCGPVTPVRFVRVDDAPVPTSDGTPNAVVVGLADGAPDVATAGADVLLTNAANPPAPWVHCSSLDETAAALDAAVRASPAAATALVQVLRATEAMPVADALTVESMAYSMLQHGETFGAWLRSRPEPRAHTDAHAPVRLDRDGDRLDVVLDRPHVHNAFNAAMRDALCEAFAVARYDDSITEVHLRGDGPSFCSGGDLSEFGLATDAAAAHLVRVERSVGRAIDLVAARVTTHLHGACIGAGIELSAFAGRVVAAPDAEVRLPEVAMGLVPGAGGTASIPRRIGRHRTAYLALSGATLDARTALAWGLVDELDALAT
jgi:enoyl-CoA hydratase/carnithine racemase